MEADKPDAPLLRFRTVRARMLFWILLVSIPIYGAALYMSNNAAAKRLEAGAERDADELAARLATGADAVIRPIEGGIRTVAAQLEAIDPPRTQYSQRIIGILGAWPEVYGSTIAVETNSEDSNDKERSRPFAPYHFRRAGMIGYSDLAADSYGYHELPWYRRAADSGQPVWSAPYFDAGGGNIWMVTYSVPFYRKLPSGNRVLAGVVTADLDLEWVRKRAADVVLGPIGMGWLSSPPDGKTFVVPIGATASRLNSYDPTLNQDAVRSAGEAMLADKVTFALLPTNIAAKPAYLAVRNLETLDWRLMLVIPQSELLGDASSLLSRQVWLGVIGLILLIAAISVVAAGVTRPIHSLAEAVEQVAQDDQFDFSLPREARRDEIGVLTDAMRRMRNSLQEHIRLRAASIAEQTRLERELEIAASIQQSMLPRAEADVNLPKAAEVAAALVPARQVGGDLYDYFPLRDGNLFFAIGDVSDKGVPAALFMARMSALLRVLGARGELPDRLLSGINARLVEGNDACMFVTIGCGMLDVTNGIIRYASAGHEAPLIRHFEGTVHSLSADNGAAIGIEASAEYRLTERFIAPGDTLVMFTDGVTEAESEDGAFWGIERLMTLLRDAPSNGPDVLVKRITDEISAHTTGFHATDDLTVLAVKFNPPSVTPRVDASGVHWLIEVETSPSGIRQAQQWLLTILSARGISNERIADVELIAEELLTNVVRAATVADGTLRLTLDCALTEERIVLTVRDNGHPFDPLARDNPNLDADIVERAIGGLGIHMVKQMSGECSYFRVGDFNIFTVHMTRTYDPS